MERDIKLIVKNKTKIRYGYGILTKNPTQMAERDWSCLYRKLVWFEYDGYWTLSKFETIEDFEKYMKHLTYTKEELFDLLCKCV